MVGSIPSVIGSKDASLLWPSDFSVEKVFGNALLESVTSATMEGMRGIPPIFIQQYRFGGSRWTSLRVGVVMNSMSDGRDLFSLQWRNWGSRAVHGRVTWT